MPSALPSNNFKFEIRTAVGPDVYTEVVGITGWDGFDGKASEIDATHLRSTAKEFLMGLPDMGNFNLKANQLNADAGQTAMNAAAASGASKKFRCTFSDASTATFDGYVTSRPISGSVDAKMEISYPIRITGPVTFAP